MKTAPDRHPFTLLSKRCTFQNNSAPHRLRIPLKLSIIWNYFIRRLRIWWQTCATGVQPREQPLESHICHEGWGGPISIRKWSTIALTVLFLPASVCMYIRPTQGGWRKGRPCWSKLRLRPRSRSRMRQCPVNFAKSNYCVGGIHLAIVKAARAGVPHPLVTSLSEWWRGGREKHIILQMSWGCTLWNEGLE